MANQVSEGVAAIWFRSLLIFIAATGFWSLSCEAQTAPFGSTLRATQITTVSAVLNGFAVPNGLPTMAWFEWGEHASNQNRTPAREVGSGTDIVYLQEPISSLATNSAYLCRLVVSNAAGVALAFPRLITTGSKVAGWNGSGQIVNFVSAPNNAVTIALSQSLGLALTSEAGTVVNWNSSASLERLATNAISVAAGLSHNLALISDGTIIGWGASGFGQLDIPAGLTNVVELVSGEDHNLALKSDGTITSWGSWTGFFPARTVTVPPGLSNVVALAAGRNHSAALKIDGTVTVWGDNYYGQSNVPNGLSNIVSIAAGAYFTIALKADGTVIGWPGNPLTGTNVVAISAGGSGSLGLTSQGNVFGGGSLSNTPAGLSNVIAIACGPNGGAYGLVHNLAPTASKVMFSGIPNAPLIASLRGTDPNADGLELLIASLPQHGGLYQYQAGDLGTRISAPYEPVSDKAGRVIFVPDPGWFGLPSDSFEYIANDGELDSAPATVTIALSGKPYSITQPSHFINGHSAILGGMVAPNGIPTATWFEWGLKGNFSERSTPQITEASGSVSRLTTHLTNFIAGNIYQYRLNASNVAGVSIGATRWCGFHGTGKVAAWGDNQLGQIRIPADLTNVVALASGGGSHTLALKLDGTVVAWGLNDQGQTKVPADLTNIVAIGAGDYHSLALRANGTVVAWGADEQGQTDVPENLTNVIAVSGGGDQSLALRANGTVVAWGANAHGESTVPSGLSNVVAIAGGWHHSLALRADGSIVAWGDNSLEQANPPMQLTNAIAIASAGGNFSLALRADGKVLGWGHGGGAAELVPLGVSNVVVIGVGSDHSFAVREDGSLAVWGLNTRGEARAAWKFANVTTVAGGYAHSVVGADNLPPIVQGMTVSSFPNRDLSIDLQASDPNGDRVAFTINSLPSVGMLYQSVNGNRGEAITNSVTGVVNPFGQVIFSPSSNALGDPYATFAIVADDGETKSSTTNVTVKIVLPPAPELLFLSAPSEMSDRLTLTFRGESNAIYRVLTSTNLLDWVSLGLATPTSNGWHQFSDQIPIESVPRFFRTSAP